MKNYYRKAGGKFTITVALVLACVCVAGTANAQTTTGLLPVPKMQFLDNSGHPLAGGKVYTYVAGTTTPQATYTDSTGGTFNSNPVILDSGGRANIWLGPVAYKIVLTTSADLTLWTADGVTSPTLSTASITIPSGQSFTMAAGSTSSFNTDILPGSANRNVGSFAHPFNTAWINTLTLNGDVTVTTPNTYDVFSIASPARNIVGYNSYANQGNLCGTPGTISADCYSFRPTILGSSADFLSLFDHAGNLIWAWSLIEGSTPTRRAISYLDLMPGTSGLKVGDNSNPWGSGYFAGDFYTGGNLSMAPGSHFGALGGNDVYGVILVSASTIGTHTFNTPYGLSPFCTLTPRQDTGSTRWWVSPSPTTVSVILSTSDTLAFNFHCMGQ